MRILEIALSGFRSYDRPAVPCHPRMNLLYGANAQGKTNFLEAIYYLSALKSFRGAAPGDLVQWGRERFSLRGLIEKNGCEWELACGHDGRSRTALLNGKTPSALSIYLEKFTCVPLIPDHIQLIQSTPGARRALIDRTAFGCDPRYLDALSRYLRALRQKSALLSQPDAAPARSLLESWNEELAELGIFIVKKRREAIAAVQPALARIYEDLLGAGEACVAYHATFPEDPAAARAALQGAMEQEIRRQRCLVGPHRDDLDIRLEGKSLKSFGSQGQKRTFLMAYRLAEVTLIRERTADSPVLLIDELGPDLDRERTRGFLSHILSLGIQVFITTTQEWLKSEVSRLQRGDLGFYHVTRGDLLAVLPDAGLAERDARP